MITRAKEKKMNSDSGNIICPKFESKGQIEFKKWIQYFERKCNEKNLQETDKLRLFPDFLGAETAAFYINNCLEVDKWEDIKKIFIEHFQVEKIVAFEDFVGMKLSDFSTLTEYFNEKTEAARKLNLPTEVIINSLNHGLPETYKLILSSHEINETFKWIATARKVIKDDIQRPSLPRNAASLHQDRKYPTFEYRPPYPDSHRWERPVIEGRSYPPAYPERNYYRPQPPQRQFRDKPPYRQRRTFNS